MGYYKVIDISQYNTVTDLEKASRSCDGVIVRLGIRGYSRGTFKVDSKFAVYVQKLISIGVPWGVYFLTQAISAAEADEEAVYCISHLMMLNRANMTLGVWCDSEYSNNLHTGRADRIVPVRRTEYANIFCRKLALSGYTNTGVYCSESWSTSMLVYSQIEYPFWIAKYGSNNGKPQIKPAVPHDLWQYTSRASVPGIKGNVDMSVLYKPLTDVIPNTPLAEEANPYQVPTYTLYRYRIGMRADYVMWLQWELNQMGYGLIVDGKFGRATDIALRDAQRHVGLTVDGKCGPATRAKLK